LYLESKLELGIIDVCEVNFFNSQTNVCGVHFVHPDFGYKGHFHRLYLAQGQISRMELGHAA